MIKPYAKAKPVDFHGQADQGAKGAFFIPTCFWFSRVLICSFISLYSLFQEGQGGKEANLQDFGGCNDFQ